MKPINAYASERHYYEKLLPIWSLLPEQLKGSFTVHPRLDGVDGEVGPPNQDGILMVASHKDSLHSIGKFIYVEHGSGQSYGGTKDWYSNAHRPNMLAALVPGPYCAQKTQKANPGVPVIQMGAPHLAGIKRQNPQKLAFAWHWRCAITIESDTAFDEYREAMFEAATRWTTIGTGHPRIIGEISAVYQQRGIEVAYNSFDVLKQCGLLVADNTSLIYEAAALDIPVILVNRYDWRRDRDYGLRFWDITPGPSVDHPSELVPMIESQLEDKTDKWKEMRKATTEYVYGSNPLGMLTPAVEKLCEVVVTYARNN